MRGKPLAQGYDLLHAHRRPDGSEADGRPDIRTESHERETERQREVGLYGQSYDLVTAEGALYIKNTKTRPVSVEVRKALPGQVTAVSPQA